MGISGLVRCLKGQLITRIYVRFNPMDTVQCSSYEYALIRLRLPFERQFRHIHSRLPYHQNRKVSTLFRSIGGI